MIVLIIFFIKKGCIKSGSENKNVDKANDLVKDIVKGKAHKFDGDKDRDKDEDEDYLFNNGKRARQEPKLA